jgi:lipoate-protein ligase A
VAAPLRVIDSGVLEGRLNIALGQALIEAHQEGHVPDTLRFLRFPPTALIGRHQALEQEVDTAYCRANGIGLVRRITGGGAIYLDPGQLGWELAIHRSRVAATDLTGIARAICHAAAASLRQLGVDAQYRPRNDIEVGGRKISGTGGFFDGDTLFYQGTVLVDMDPETMMAALRVPRAKLEKRALDSAAQRVVTLKELLGEACPGLEAIQRALVGGFCDQFGLEATPGAFTDAERDAADALFDEEIGRDEFVNEIEEPSRARGVLQGEHTGPGGTIRTYLRLQGPAQNRIASVLITGDFFVTPPRVVYDLEGALRGLRLDQVAGTLDCFFRDTDIQVLSVGKQDFLGSLQAAIEARGGAQNGD